MRTTSSSCLRSMRPVPTAIGLLLVHAAGAGAMDITYSLASDNGTWPPDKRAAIVAAMDEAVDYYNANGYFAKTLKAHYDPSVPTANANYAGTIRFGGQISTRTALHEISHTLGVGTIGAWSTHNVGGTWDGPHANARLQLYNGNAAEVRCDSIHFWSSAGTSYGLNFAGEDTPVGRLRHVRMVAALRWDMGIVADSDGDDLPDDWETFHFGTLASRGDEDPDLDGVSNLAEYNEDTDPLDGLLLPLPVVVTNHPAAAQPSFDFGPATLSAFYGASAPTPNALISSQTLSYLGVNASAFPPDGNVNAINDGDGVSGGSDQERLRIAIQPGSALTRLTWNWSRADGPLSTDGVSISGFLSDPGATFGSGISGTPTYSAGILRFQISQFDANVRSVFFTHPAASDGATLEITVADSDQAAPQLALRSLSFTSPGTLFYSDFDAHTGSAILPGGADDTTGAATLTVPWTTAPAVTSVSALTAMSSGDSGALGGFVQLSNGTAPLANADNVYIGRNHSLDTNRTTSRRGFNLNFTVDRPLSLSRLTVFSGHATGSGTDETQSSTLVYRLSGGTLGAPVFGSSVEDYAVVPTYHPVTFDLAGATIGAGDYLLEIYQTRMLVGDAYAIFDGIALAATNRVPVPGMFRIGCLENHPVSLPTAELVAAGTDPDGNPLSVAAVDATSTNGGQVVLNGGTITYQPATNDVGGDVFTYLLSDGFGGTATGTVHVDVVPDDTYFNRLSAPGPLGSGTVTWSYQGIPHLDYVLEAATNLTAQTNWIPLLTNTADSTGAMVFPVTPSEPRQYFRARSAP